VIGSPGCTENYGKHACDQDAFDGYLSRFNRKLTCCMRSGSRLNSADHRLDCIQNRNTDFNALWATSDADHDGGQTHAMTLVSAGSIISGFYTKDGVLCPQFSEFVAPGGILTRYKIEPTLKTIQQEHVDHASGKTQIGDPYPALRIPLQVLSSIQTQGRRNNYPSTINEMNQCPILVRAALRVECPPGSPTDAAGNIRCETAQTLSVRVRIEQLFHIAGSAPMVVVDTSLNPEQATQFNLKEIFRRTAK
jgi:hypothetical protein